MSCVRQIEYDVSHGVTRNEVASVFDRIQHNNVYKEMMSDPEIMSRTRNLEHAIFTTHS
jgi:hypothetical protein